MKISFKNKPSPFSNALKEKVDSYFKNRKISTTGNASVFLKSITLILSLLAIYIALVFFNPAIWLAIPLCILLGINLALVGFNVMHDGGHGSISKHKWVNGLSAYTLNLMGGNAQFWKLSHNISHHTYTNIEGEDQDIDLKPFMRLSENQPLHWFHKYQFIYWVFLYGFSYLMWILVADFKKYFTGKLTGGGEKQRFSKKEHWIFWLSKAFYVVVFLLLPLLMLGIVKAAIGFAIVAFVCGFVLSIVFQMAHTVEATKFPVPDKTSNKVEQEWAVHQVNTTADFAPTNKVLSWFLGGLNFQVEHHLFPRVSHVYYSKLRPLVKDTCTEFGLRYNEYPSFFQAIKSHVHHLRRLGMAK